MFLLCYVYKKSTLWDTSPKLLPLPWQQEAQKPLCLPSVIATSCMMVITSDKLWSWEKVVYRMYHTTLRRCPSKSWLFWHLPSFLLQNESWVAVELLIWKFQFDFFFFFIFNMNCYIRALFWYYFDVTEATIPVIWVNKKCCRFKMSEYFRLSLQFETLYAPKQLFVWIT